MMPTISANWTSMEPLMKGLKLGGLMNNAIEQDGTFRAGRHHFMTAVNQILEGTLVLEQVARCFEAANMNYSLAGWHAVAVIVPTGAAYLASRQIKVVSDVANFVQDRWENLNFVMITVASVVLFHLGQTFLAATTLTYLSIGVLNRYNVVLPESAKKAIRQADFFIGSIAGLYLGGNFVRLICAVNLMIKAVEKYFDYKKLSEKQISPPEKEDPAEQHISLSEIKNLTNDIECSIRKAHLHKKPLPKVDEDVQIDDILTIYNCIDWSLHKDFVERRLKKDKRWLEKEQFRSKPLDYFKSSLYELIEQIKNRAILEGQPISYDMLELYCRYIAQEIKKQDEMTQVDTLVHLGIDGGKHCGTGKFGSVEDVYENLSLQSTGQPLETRVLACMQQERQRIWQHIYTLIWKMDPLFQGFGYLTGEDARHNMNIFINLVGAGEKYGIPDEAAKNDQTATINPISHYMALNFAKAIEFLFWEGWRVPQKYVSIEDRPKSDWWKVWKWVHLKKEDAYVKPYNQKNILECFSSMIGSPQIFQEEIYAWWLKWIDRQDDLTDDQKENLKDELGASPVRDAEGKLLPLIFAGQPFEVNGKIQPMFLKAMLIEMGILNKP